VLGLLAPGRSLRFPSSESETKKQMNNVTLHPLLTAFPLQCEREGCKEPQEFIVREVKITNGKYDFTQRRLCKKHAEEFKQEKDQ
jgi:hypothetical protein